ncbi:MAG: SRPBCC family protein [Caulobacterales bacterium]|nr:SRPBCC family protein [Caulobacterales bacterium]
MNAATIKPAPIRKTLSVKASREKAFKVFTEGLDRWWPKSHTIGEAPLREAVLEPREGGRWYGISETGAQDNWGEVLTWEPPARLVLAWRISGEWKCDPTVHTEVEVRFTEAGDGTTLVEFEHRMLENLGAGAVHAAEQMNGGWVMILGRFKDVLEA